MVSFPVLFSDTVKNNRWAAEFYRPGFSFEPIDPSKWCKIRQITSDKQYGMSLVMNQEDRGFPIYRLNEIDNCFLSETPEKCADVSRREAAPFFMKDGDILFCRTNGNINYVGRTGIWYGSEEMVFASYLVKVRTKQNELSPEYLTVYLNTAFGRRQIVRRAMPSNQVNVSASELMKIDVYVPDADIQKTITELVRKAYKVRKSALLAYALAQALLSSSLNEGGLKLDHPLSYTTKFSDVMREGRADAEFFHAKYQPLLDLIKHFPSGFDRLGDISRKIEVNFRPEKSSAAVNYTEIGDVDISNGRYTYSVINASALPANAKIRLRGGELLISTVRPTRGAIAIADDQLPDGVNVCSGAFYVCDIEDRSRREVIWLYLRMVKSLFEKYCGGTSYPTIDANYLRDFPIPRFDKQLSNKVKRLIKKSKDEAAKSEFLLAAAKARVEELIEAAVK
jgi:hypothetical protein